MKKVKTIVRNLDQLSTYITDTSPLSSNIFNITEFPLEFTIGKNLIKLKGNSNIFQVGTELAIEILDSNRNPIYHEIIDYIESDTSRVLAVYIYNTTPPGNCTITIAAVLSQLYTGEQIPNSWKDQLNVKWSRTLSVNNKATNTSEIIFEDTKLPTVEVSEQIGVRLDRLYDNNDQFPTYTTGLIEFENKNNVILGKITGGEFNPKFDGGTITVTSPVNALPIPLFSTSSAKPYSSKIKKILNKDFIELEDKYIFTYSQSLTQHEFIKFDPSSFSLSYEATPTYIPTQHSESFALTQIKNLDPGTGDVSRIKLYINSTGTIGTYELINDILLEPTEIFVDATGSVFPDVSVGYFTSQSIIDQYWEVNQYNAKSTVTKPVLTFSTSSLNNALVVTPSVSYSGDKEAIVLQTTSSLPGVFVKDSEYKIVFDAIATKNSLSNLTDPKICIYLSGSAFDYDNTDLLNDYFPKILGKKIGEYETTNSNQRLDDLQFNFIADNNGDGSLLIVIKSGQWEFSDIRTLTSAEIGFTENYTRFRTDIPVKHKSDNEIKFKIEYYNAAGVKSDHETIVLNKVFEGGNRYIDGGFSMLTGSLTVADTLNSGVEIVGLQNTGYIRSLGYEGFNQAMTGRGGFLLFSGSALPNQFATSYQGVGLEMVANANNFFKFRTDPSALEIQTEKFFLGNPSTQFISGSNGQLEISSSGYHIQPSGDITASNFLMQGGVITNDVTILGSVSANSILTPAVINGSPATPSNASSSISDQGLAIFRSASIAGFNISPEEIRSPGDALRLKSIGQITASDGFLFGSKAASNFIQFAGSTLTVRGDLSVDQIFTPAVIGGSASDITNASSSITSDGFAQFKSASIGGWDITSNTIEGGNLLMRPSGILQTRDFASGVKGWKISSEGNGTAEFENVRIRGTLRTTTFEKESVNAVGGQLWVTNATTISGSNVLATDTTMSVENASGFTPGEILLSKRVDGTGFQTEYLFLESASVDGNNTGSDEVHGRLYVQRGYGSGSQGTFVGDLASTSQSYDEGQVIVSTGLSGSGYIKMNANPRDSNTPFIDIVERTGSDLYDVQLRSRLGDLSGLANSSYVFGNDSPGFGLATDNVFLQGGIIANTGSIAGIEMEAGKLYIGVGNHANSDTGFYVDSGSNFSLGDKLTWDGSALTVQGQLRLSSGQTVDNAINEATASNTAKSLILTSDSQIMAFDSASDNTATPSTIIFSIAQQNLTASISASNVTITTAQSTNVTGFDFDTGSITVNSAGLHSGIVSGSISFAGGLTAGGLETDKDNFPVSITVNGDSLTDTTSLFKVEGGSTGSDGAPGEDGTDAVTAFLTNESHTFAANSAGTIPSFAGGDTDMEVFEGVTNKTSAYSFGRVDGPGVSSNIVNNTVTVTGLTGDTGSIAITATSASTSLTKTMSLAKSKQGDQGDPGSTAKLITLTTDSQVFSFLSASSNDAIDNDILFIINQQNLSGTIASSDITITTAQDTSITGFTLDTNSVTSGTGIVSGSITFTGNTNAGGLNSTKANLPLSIEVSKDSVSDSTKIFKLEGGSSGSAGSDGTPGSDGQSAITAFLTNESHTFPATADGTVPDFSTGTTEMIVFLGLENVTSSFTFTGSNSLGVTATSSSNSLTVTGMAHDSGSINFTAISASVSLTKTMNLAKSKTGESGSTAKTLTLTSDSQVFSFASASATTALDDDILIIFNQQNLSGPIISGDITIKDSTNSTLSNPTLKTDVTNGSGQVSGSITFSSTVSGDKTKLPLTIEVTKDSLSDTTRIFKLDGGSSGSDGSDGAPGADGAPAVTAFLTNESHTFPADQNGTVSSFVDGVTDMIVFVGLTNSTSSFTYSRTNSLGVTSTLSGTDGNTLTINSMSHDSGSVDIIATSASVSVTKTMTLAKSKQGEQGTTGQQGATGPNFDFLTGSISEIDTTGGLSAGLLMTSNVLGFHDDIAQGSGPPYNNATISDFISFLDSSGNFFIGSASAGHFAYSQATGQLLVSGSKVDIQTPKFFLGSTNNQFVSGANGNIEISSSKFHVKPDGDVIVRKVSAEEGTIGGFTISTDEVRSTNNRLRLKDSGQITGSAVLFSGGEIGGFVLSSDEIRSENNNLRLKSNGQITASAAQITGKITAQEGTIGGFDIGTNLESSGGTLNLKGSTGQITGSNVLFSGGEIGGFVITDNAISSSNGRLRLKDNGQITGSEVLLSGGRITSGVTIEGSVTANAIRTPATIGGSPSTDTNASSSIKSDGFATFKSASIAGFEITTDEISGGFIPASSSILNTVVSASLQLDGAIETSTVSVDSFTTNAAGGAAFWEALRQAGTGMKIKANSGASYYNISSTSTDTFTPQTSLNAGSISIGGANFIEIQFTNQPHTLVDNGGSTLTAISSSTQNFPETPAPLLLKSNGQITASSGLIGGTEIQSDKLQSTTNLPSPDSSPSFELTSTGVISGSEAFIRRVTNLGSGNQVVPLLDSRIGLLDGRNLGRQLAESYTQYARSNVDDGSTFTTVATHVAQLLPYENTLVASFQMFVQSLGASTNGQVKFLVETTANSGSYTGTSLPAQYDNFSTTIGNMTKSLTRGSFGVNAFLAFGDESLSLSIAESNQARFIRISVQLLVNPFNTQSSNSLNKVTLKGYSIVATRALSAAAIGSPQSDFPSSAS